MNRLRAAKNVSLLLVIFSFFACKKDIPVPHSDLKQIFGRWEWAQSSGGLAGTVSSPASAGHSQVIEYNKNGVYKLYQDGKQKIKMDFSLEEKPSAPASPYQFIVRYKETGNRNPWLNVQEIRFQQDTLFLQDQCDDCFSHIYTRKR